MKSLEGTETFKNLKKAFAGEAQANRRYIYFARKADELGYSDIAAVFRAVSEGETAHAIRHFEFLRVDPVTEIEINDVRDMLQSAVKGETYEYTEMYPQFAKTAREEGFEDIAKWFETLAKAEEAHSKRFTKTLENL